MRGVSLTKHALRGKPHSKVMRMRLIVRTMGFLLDAVRIMFKERVSEFRREYSQPMSTIKRTVFIYAKPPMIGVSKTRLAAGLGAATAQRVARWSFEKTLRAARDPRWETVLAVAPDAHLNDTLGGLWPSTLRRIAQGSGDLTDRLNRGLDAAPNGAVVFIGADCPDITPALIAGAFDNLKKNDAVFGPSSDGGFWLFGMNKQVRTPSPFNNVRWSTKHALGDVRDNLFGSSTIAYLPELSDIDTAEDWAARSKDAPANIAKVGHQLPAKRPKTRAANTTKPAKQKRRWFGLRKAKA